MKKQIRKTLPETVHAIVTYYAKTLSSKFKVKDKTEFYYQSILVYYGKCFNRTCTEGYIRKNYRRVKERIIDHIKSDKTSHILKH